MKYAFYLSLVMCALQLAGSVDFTWWQLSAPVVLVGLVHAAAAAVAFIIVTRL